MLRSEAEYQVDDKGRLTIPPDFRGELSHGFYLTRGWHGCLFLFLWEKWREIEKKLEAVPLTNMYAVDVQRFFCGGVEGKVDGQGRIALPPTLREFAGIEKDVLVRGIIDRVEIWSKERWLEYLKAELAPEAIAKKAEAMGIF